MKLFTIFSAGLVLAAASAQAQSPSPGPHYTATSDLGGPYAEMPPPGGSGYSYGPNNHGPMLMPPPGVYTVLRDHGFSPRGTPRQRGFFYTIAVTDRRGEDGRLVIDARNGRIARFVPAYRWGPGFGPGPGLAYGPSWRMPPMGPAPRPPAPVPRVASRTPATVPLPKPEPAHTAEVKPDIKLDAKPLAERPATAPEQKSAANQAKPAEAAPAPARPASAPVEAKPSPSQQPDILPTQEMPKVQGFE
jgi:hypothetical protein